MKKINEIWKSINKKLLLIGIAVIGVIVLIILIIFNLVSGKRETLICTISDKKVAGFTINEEIKITMRNDKVYSFSATKEVQMTSTYSKHEIYHTILENSFNNAYQYVGEDNYEIEKQENGIKAKVKIKEVGAIFNNLEITTNNPNSPYDLEFNTVNDIESSSQTVLIGEEYKITELEKKVEDFGYTCK